MRVFEGHTAAIFARSMEEDGGAPSWPVVNPSLWSRRESRRERFVAVIRDEDVCVWCAAKVGDAGKAPMFMVEMLWPLLLLLGVIK